MKLVRRQSSSKERFLLLTDPDPKTGAARGLIADVSAQTVERVRNADKLLKSPVWQPLTSADPDLDSLVRLIPALRRHRGIEIRLLSGVTAWILWRQWSSADPVAQAQLAALTREVAVPAYEPDGDYFLAVQATAILGGSVLDAPRTVFSPGQEGY